MRIIAGRWRGHSIHAPKGRGVRPTTDRTREAWMNVLQPLLSGARVVDLFAGSGALGLEALSRGAEHVTFVERAGGSLKALRRNVEALGAESGIEVVRDDAIRYAERLGPGEFDLALADPPYGGGDAAALVRAFEKVRFADWLSVEHRVTDDVPTPPGSETRRYGDTAITFIPAEA